MKPSDEMLFQAVQSSNPVLVQTSLNEGADINASDEDGNIPLHLALLRYSPYLDKSEKVVIALIDKGSNLSSKAGGDQNPFDGYTPLHIAIERKYDRIVDELIAHRCDVNAKEDHGDTPLHFAASSGQLEIVKKLVEKGANRNAKNAMGQTPFAIAKYNGYEEIAQFLLKNGAK